MFYKNPDIVLIFEVVVPMADVKTTNRIYYYYKNVVVNKENKAFCDTELKIKLKDWIGEFFPKKIEVIPLFEHIDEILNSHNNDRAFLVNKLDEIAYQRVFLARSEPAMNDSSMSTVIALKLVLEILYNLQESIKIPIYPITWLRDSTI